jgi:hypothetical protein
LVSEPGESRRIVMAMRAIASAAREEIGLVDYRSPEPPSTLFATHQTEAMHALTVGVERVDRGDVVAVGQLFYCVDSVVPTRERFGFALIVLRNLESGACSAIEFRNPDAMISVLRFQTTSCSISETVDTYETPLRPRKSQRRSL